MKEMQDAAPHKGGSGRVNDFLQHISEHLLKYLKILVARLNLKEQRKLTLQVKNLIVSLVTS